MSDVATADGHARYVGPGEGPLTVHDVLHLAPYEWLAATLLAGATSCCDFGSGVGYGVDRLARSVTDVIGIEQSATAVAHARATYPERTFFTGDVADRELMQRIGRRFDAVVSLQVIEHVEDWPAMIANMADLVADDGVVAICTRNRRYTYRRYPNHRLTEPSHVIEFTPEVLTFGAAAFFEDVQLIAMQFTGLDIAEAAARMDALPSRLARTKQAIRRQIPDRLYNRLRPPASETPGESFQLSDLLFIPDPDHAALDEAIDLMVVCRNPKPAINPSGGDTARGA